MPMRMGWTLVSAAGDRPGEQVGGPVGLEEVPLLRRPPDEALDLAGQQLGHPGDVVAEPPEAFGRNRRPDDAVAAVSVGLVGPEVMLDLDYGEDSNAEVDMNVVMLDCGEFVEVQGTAEGKTYSRDQLNILLDMAEQGIRSHIAAQKKILGHVLST